MKEELISLRTAKLAKEKGFKANLCRELFYPDIYNKGEFITNECTHDWELIEDKDWYSRPTQSLLQKWIREVHNIDVFADCIGSGKYFYTIYVNDESDTKFVQDDEYKFEVALEEGLFQALKLIKI